MAKSLRCANGHHWEIEQSEDSLSESSLCPVCGAGVEDTVSATISHDAEECPDAGLTFPAVAGYQIEGLLGRGGMGVVYKARQVSLKRLVALKMILAGEHAGPKERSRFRKEAEAVARLAHPNIVQIHEIGEQQGRPFFALEYVEGGSLARKLAGEPQPPRAAADLTETLARAMAAVHQQGIVHRDLKPANILLQHADGRVPNEKQQPNLDKSASSNLGTAIPKITDFGLAKNLEEDADQTRSGAILGTPAYMAPEQAAGDIHSVGPAADIYALGAILYEMLTGRPPFRAATTAETLRQVCAREPVSPRQLNPAIDRDLETITLKCLQKEPARRYDSAGALADDLKRYSDRRPILARPVGSLERLRRWGRRNPLVALLIAGIALTLVAASGISAFFAIKANDEAGKAISSAKNANEEKVRANDIAEKEKIASKLAAQNAFLAKQKEDLARKETARANANLDQAQQNERQALRLLYVAEMGLAFRAWHDANLPRMIELLEKHIPRRAQDEDLRSWEWNYLWRLSHPKVVSIERHMGNLGPKVAFVEGGSLVAAVGLAGSAQTVILFDPVTGMESKQLGTFRDMLAETMTASPDGHSLAVAFQDGTIRVWDLKTGNVTHTLARPKKYIRDMNFSHDGQRLVVLEIPAQTTVLDRTTGKPVFTLAVPGQQISCVACSMDGKYIAGGCSDGTVRIWNMGNGTERQVLRGGQGARSLALSTNSKLLAGALLDGSILIWDVETGALKSVLSGHKRGVNSVAFSPGMLLASAGADRTVRLWDMNTGKEKFTLRGHRNSVAGLSFSPNSSRLASASYDGTVKIWNTVNAPEALTGFHGNVIGPPVFSHDSRRVALPERDQGILFWNRLTGMEELLKLPHAKLLKLPHAGEITSLAYGSDGRLVTGCRDRLVRIWDAAGKEERTLRGHSGEVITVALSGDGRRIASTAVGNAQKKQWGEVKVWDAAGGQTLFDFAGKEGYFSQAVLNTDGSLLAAASNQGITVWEMSKGTQIHAVPALAVGPRTLVFHPDGRRLAWGNGRGIFLLDALTGTGERVFHGHAGAVNGVAITPDGKRLVSAGGDATIRVWDISAGQEILSLEASQGSSFFAAISPDGRCLASTDLVNTLKIWEADTGLVSFTLGVHPEPVNNVSFSGDSKLLASASFRNGVSIWDMTTCKLLANHRVHNVNLRSIALSFDGKRLATAGSVFIPNKQGFAPGPPGVKVWDAASGREISALPGSLSANGVAFSPDGSRLATAGPVGVEIWDWARGQKLLNLKGHSHEAAAVVFSPDGLFVASASRMLGGPQGEVKLWDAGTGKEIRLQDARSAVLGLAFGPGGKRLASAGADHIVRIWDVATGRKLHTLRGHAHGVFGVAFSPDGRWLVSVSQDCTVRIWDAEQGKLLWTLTDHNLPVLCVAFASDGRTLVTGGLDRNVRRWDLGTLLEK